MNEIIGYLRNYFQSINRTVFLLTTLLVGIAITCNYTLSIEPAIVALSSWPLRIAGFFMLFGFIFSAAWVLQFLIARSTVPYDPFFLVLLLAAPAIFAIKITFGEVSNSLTAHFPYPWNQYWNKVLDWPLKLLVVVMGVTALWRLGRFDNPIAGVQAQGFRVKPYLLLLLGMVPLIAFAATQNDFLHTYPKVQRIDIIDQYVQPGFLWKGLYELSYGIDFLTIEFFFRGFLVLAFARFAGKHAILPVAAFYCSIHFGKPLFECITSYFGGIILGAVVYNTRSIWGGLIVHLGIAWLMELAGYLGHVYKGG
ncbi:MULTISPECIES: CPBP family intramembrane glutamic endopeptidase [Niastella]|uniref:CPBP family intramembrane metalloprotease n=1 Tax=Niastella soli TaxID=2821487 RepID=A0ABS3YXV6_9BACT|nr:CPBP family intramembrane glutamic endopeptidase [Niastella soli]MBO9202760.1 CPBP family intramembrane metalloprotease [Niastella soli]